MSAIVDVNGNPMRPRASSYAQHAGADLVSKELSGWWPSLMSADGAWKEEREILQARSEDAFRNSGHLTGVKQLLADNIIGADFLLAAKPDHKALGITSEAAQEWAREVQSEWGCYAYDIDSHIDTTMHFQLPGLVTQAFLSNLVSYEIVALADWLPNRGGKYATAIQNMDPARLSTPDDRTDDERLRMGVQKDARGAPRRYWFASNLAGDPLRFGGSKRWRSVPKYTRWGRRLVFHTFEPDKVGASRGRGGMVSILKNVKSTEKLSDAHLQASVLNAALSAVIHSSYDWKAVSEALGSLPPDATAEQRAANDPVNNYLGGVLEWYERGNMKYNGANVTHLYPGEELELKSSEHPSANFADFKEVYDRELAAAFNMSYSQYSRDFTKTNYSSMRASQLDSFLMYTGRRKILLTPYARWIYSLWLEEAMDKGTVPTPAGAPSFWEAKTAYTKCEFRGPARGHIDPVKGVNAMERRLALGVTNLEKEAAEEGTDWRDNMDQRLSTIKYAQELAAAAGDGVEWRDLVPGAAKEAAEVPQQVELADD